MSRDRLKYVVPQYIWAQPKFTIDWEAARPILEIGRGIVIVESSSLERREYAAASFLSLVQSLDYHADVGWTSFYPLKVDEFTGAYRLPSHRKVQAISIKTEITPELEEQVTDLAVSCEIALIATPLGFTLRANHVRLLISARKDQSNYQAPYRPSVI